jgi:hypothetical protein
MKLLSQKNKFLLGSIIVSFSVMIGFQNCSPDQYYKNDPNTTTLKPLSTDLSKLTYLSADTARYIDVGDRFLKSIVLDLETGHISYIYIVGTENGTTTSVSDVKLDGPKLDSIQAKLDSIKIRKCTSEEVASASICGGYNKLILNSIYKSDPEKKVFFQKVCESTSDLITDSNDSELYDYLLTFHPNVTQ